MCAGECCWCTVVSPRLFDPWFQIKTDDHCCSLCLTDDVSCVHHKQLCNNSVCLLVGLDSQSMLISVDSCCAGRHAVYHVPSGHAEDAHATEVSGYKVVDLPSMQSRLSYIWQTESLLNLCCYCNSTACSLQQQLHMHISVHLACTFLEHMLFRLTCGSLNGPQLQGSYMH